MVQRNWTSQHRFLDSVKSFLRGCGQLKSVNRTVSIAALLHLTLCLRGISMKEARKRDERARTQWTLPGFFVFFCLCRACGAQQLIGDRRLDEAWRRLCLPSGSDSEGWNIFSLNSLLLSMVMWTAASTLSSLRRAVSEPQLVLPVLLFKTHPHTRTKTTQTYTVNARTLYARFP